MRTQIEIENENRELMVAKAKTDFKKASDSKNVAQNTYLKNIMNYYSAELSAQLRTYTDEIMSGHAKVKAVNAKMLAVLDLDIVSHYTIKAILNCCGSRHVKLSYIVTGLARVLETEYRLNKLQEVDETNYKKLNSFINKSGYSGERKIKVINDLLNKYSKDVLKDYKINFTKLATLCIQMVATTQPVVNGMKTPILCVIVKENSRDIKKANTIEVMAWVREYLISQFEQGNFITSYNTALVEAPLEWTTLKNGGFHTPFFKYNLIKSNVELSNYHGVNLQPTFQAVNTLQNTKWRINKKILELQKFCMEKNLGWGNLPKKVTMTKLPYPFPNTEFANLTDAQKALVIEWRIKTTSDYDSKISEDSKYMSLFRTMNEAERFKEYEQIYFAYFLDFRGRAYPVASNLNPQGTDHVKALLEFGEGKEITTKEAEMFFFAQGANTYGHGLDKKSIIEKHKWVKDNHAEIIKAALNPQDESTLWHSSDEDPWLFLSFCLEYKDYVEYGVNFKSHLVVAMDGSCNGLQHLSAMLFDEVGGKSVNITNNAVKQDIYTDVLHKVIKKLESSESPLASSLLALGIDRKLVKRPVMIVPYSGTKTGIKGYIDEELKLKGAETLFKDQYGMALNLITDFVWESIKEVIIKGSQIMELLNKLARDLVKESRSTYLEWTSPNGFKVIQNCVKQEEFQIQSKMGDTILKMDIRVDTDKTNVKKHGFGIAPNLIHSLDAAHLQMTINSMAPGISYAMIHDSFGVHAAHSAELFKALREVFYNLYKDGDVLVNFLQQQGVDVSQLELPTTGSLQLEGVLKSEYFFS